MNTWLKRLFRTVKTNPSRNRQRHLPLGLETLEDRLTPAVTTFAAGVLTIDFNAVNENLGVNNNGTNISLTSSAAITGAGNTFATADVTRIVVTDSGDRAGQLVEFNGSYTLPNGLASTGVETFNLDGSLDASGSMGIAVTAPKEITIIGSLTTSDGDIVLSANQQMTPTSGNFIGINIPTGTITTSGTGNISFSGRGGDSGSNNHGIRVQGGAVVRSTSTPANAGTITLDGTGGTGTSSNHGVFLGGGSGAQVTSMMGAIQITGHGGGATSSNIGVVLDVGGVVSSTGTGANAATITLDGTGASGTTNNFGVLMQSATAQVTSVDGDIQVTAQGGSGTGNNNFGLRMVNAVVSSTGTGTGAAKITLDGIGGGTGGSSSTNLGVTIVSTAPKVASVDGAIEIIGAAGAGISTAIELFSSNTVVVTGTAPITLIADSMSFDADPLIAAGSNTVTLRQKTVGAAINLGGEDAADVLGLSNDELNDISAGTIRIGDDSTGTITVSAPLEHLGDANFVVTSRRNINFVTGSGWTTTDGDLSFNANLQQTPTTGSFVGISIGAATIATTGTGALSLKGRGGDNGGNNTHGILIANGGKVQSTSSSSDAGTITLQGTGGAGVSNDVGVQLFDGGSLVTSVSGDILITGQGGAGTGNNNRGVRLFGDVQVSSTGMGANAATITIEGSGVGNTPNHGVLISGAGSTAKVTSVDGAIQITGTSGVGSTPAIEMTTLYSVASTGTATVTLIGDSLGINADDAIVAGANTVVLRPKTATTTIDVGGTDAAGVLGLSSDELNNIVAGVIAIGDANTSALTVSASINFDNPLGNGPALELKTGGTIDLNATLNTDGGSILVQAPQIRTQADLTATTSTSGTITFDGGILDVGGSPGRLTVQGNLSLSTGLTYHVEIDGPVAGTDYDQVSANNAVSVGNAILDLDFGFTPALNQSFTLLAQQGDSGLDGQFAGLPNGAQFVEDGLVFQISYENGNVIVTRIAPPATNLVVDNLSDGSDGNLGPNQLTLREAIELANLLPDANTISFAATLVNTPQTIALTGGQFTLTSDVTISGPGAKLLSIDAGGASRHFTVNAVTAAISGLTLKNGEVGNANGGSIDTSGTLAVTACVFVNNHAAAGGAINNAGELTVSRSTFDQNRATFGGGIAHGDGTLMVSASTFTRQLATNTGGAIISDSTLVVIDSTVSGNKANSTAGGIFGINGFTLANSIVAGNLKGGDVASDLIGTVTDGGFNLIGTGGSGGLVNGTNFNLVGVDPLLGPLADNGGPTPTMALLTGSPAIDAGGPSGPVGTDQRGFTRPFDVTGIANASDGRDIGAFEQQTLSLTSNSTADTVDPNDGVVTFREAILAALANPGADTITLDPALSGQTISLASPLPPLTSDVNIFGPTGGLTLDANALFPILMVGSGASVSLSDLNFVNGFGTEGGALRNFGSVNLTDCDFTGNQSASGGAVSNLGDMTITGGTFTDNAATFVGGALYNQATMAVLNVTFSDNTAGTNGGGIFNMGTLTLTGSTLSGNSANSGGGLFNQNTLRLTNATLSGNQAQVHGGGISNSGMLTVVNSTIVLNKDDQADNTLPSGGGIYQSAGSLTLSNTLVAGNTKGTNPSTPSDLKVDGGTVSGSHNLIGDPNSAGGLTTANGNLLGNGSGGLLAIEKIIDLVLSDNGGATLTHALVNGSRAIDAGDNALAVDALAALWTTDQRGTGFDRVKGARVDIGAFESDAVFAGGFDGTDLDDDFNLTAGRFSIVNGKAVAQGNKPAQAILDGVNLPDVALAVDVTLAGNGSRAGLLAHYSPKQGKQSESYYWARLIQRNGQVFAEILRYSHGKVKKLASTRVQVQNSAAHLRFEVSGSSLTLFVDGTQRATAVDDTLSGAGVGMRARKGAALDNLVVNSLLAAFRRQPQSGLSEG